MRVCVRPFASSPYRGHKPLNAFFLELVIASGGPCARARVHVQPMLDRWAIGAIVLLGLVCVFSTYVALDVWLPDPRERARIRAERVEHMLREEGEDRLEAATMAEA